MFKCFALVIAFGGTLASAQSNTTRYYTAYDTETITVAGTAIGFTASKVVPSGAAYRAELVTFTVECVSTTPCPIRFEATSTTPTSTVGTLLGEGDVIRLYNYDNITLFKAIRTGANSASIQPIYWR